jgi:hypothetical protein
MYGMYEYGSTHANAAEARRRALWGSFEGGRLSAALEAAQEWRDETAAKVARARSLKAAGAAQGLRLPTIARLRRAVGAPLIRLGQHLQGTPHPSTTSGVAPSAGR